MNMMVQSTKVYEYLFPRPMGLSIAFAGYVQVQWVKRRSLCYAI